MRQPCLFKFPKPLLERFGKEFFEKIPRTPGVYIMSGAGNRILYVGQSKNLRTRLAMYKNAQPERVPRKVIRMVQRVELITWECCQSPESARLRENELLRLHRPRFNVVNTHPQSYFFFHWKFREGVLEFGLSNEFEACANCYGAFKHRALGREAMGAFARLLWAATHRVASHGDYPRELLRPKAPLSWRMDLKEFPEWNGAWVEAFRDYWAGTSLKCLEILPEIQPCAEERFLERFQTADRETIQQFFESGPKRHLQLRQRHGIQESIISRNELDDLIVLNQTKPGSQESSPLHLNGA